METTFWLSLVVGLVLTVLFLFHKLGQSYNRYYELVNKFILYKASSENRTGAGVLLQAEKLRGIAREPVDKKPEVPQTGVSFQMGMRE